MNQQQRGVGTYTVQQGYYSRIGELVYAVGEMIWTAHTGSGNTRVNMPFTCRNQTNYNPMGLINVEDISLPGGTVMITFRFNNGLNNATPRTMRSNNSSLEIALPTTGTIQFSGWYISMTINKPVIIGQPLGYYFQNPPTPRDSDYPLHTLLFILAGKLFILTDNTPGNVVWVQVSKNDITVKEFTPEISGDQKTLQTQYTSNWLRYQLVGGICNTWFEISWNNLIDTGILKISMPFLAKNISPYILIMKRFLY